MPKDLELAKELYEIYQREHDYKIVEWEETEYSGVRIGFIKLARHVESLLIDRAIEELALWFDKDLQPEIKKRIAELQKEKELL